MYPGKIHTIVASGLLFASLNAYASEPMISYYDVSGRSEKDLRRNLNELRPHDSAGKRHDALTKSRIGISYKYAPTSTGCKFTEFSPTLETSILMPRWAASDPSTKIGRKWQSYYSALYDHELGHHNIYVKALSELADLGKTFETGSKCIAIGEEFKIIYSDLLEKYRALNKQYDLDTNHGMKYGAVFP